MKTAQRPRTSAQLNAERYARKPLVEGRLVNFSFYLPDIYWRHVAAAVAIFGVLGFTLIATNTESSADRVVDDQQLAVARLAIGPDVSQATLTIQDTLDRLQLELKRLDASTAAMAKADSSEDVDPAPLRRRYEAINTQVSAIDDVFHQIDARRREVAVRHKVEGTQLLTTEEQDALANAAFQQDLLQERLLETATALAALDTVREELVAAELKAKEEAERQAELAAAAAARQRAYSYSNSQSSANVPSLPRRQTNFSRRGGTSRPNWRSDRW